MGACAFSCFLTIPDALWGCFFYVVSKCFGIPFLNMFWGSLLEMFTDFGTHNPHHATSYNGETNSFLKSRLRNKIEQSSPATRSEGYHWSISTLKSIFETRTEREPFAKV